MNLRFAGDIWGQPRNKENDDPGFYIPSKPGPDIDPGFYVDGKPGPDIDPGFYVDGKLGSEINRGFDPNFYIPQPLNINEMFVDPKRGFSNIPNKDRYLLQGTFVDPKRGFSPPIDEIPRRYDPRTGQLEPINKGPSWSY